MIDEYGLLDRTVYADPPKSYGAAVRSLAVDLPRLLVDRPAAIRDLPAILAAGARAPKHVATLRAFLGADPGRFDVCHAHFGPVADAVRLAVAHADAPFVASFYGYDVGAVLADDSDRYRALFRSVEAVTALSEDMRDDLVAAGSPPGRTRVLPLSIDGETFAFAARHPPDDGPVRLLSVCRLIEKKGIRCALQAVADLASEHDLAYDVVGDGPLRDDLEALATELDIRDAVTFHGWVEQSGVASAMRDAHVFVLPSVVAADGDSEGTPTVLLEAQAMGLPVVATEHAGIPEIVADGEAGLLVPERDVGALTEAPRTLLAEPERWPEMGRAGRRNVEENHSMGATVERLEALYDEILEGDS